MSELPQPVLHSVGARDGWLLRVWDFRPPLEREVRGVVVVGHALLVDSRTLCRPDRPTLASVLVAAGFRVLAPDLRGHGESGPSPQRGGEWSLDDQVGDVAHYVELAASLEPERPIALVGHSLFSHAALAWLGLNPDAAVRAVVALGFVVWNRRFERRRWRWWLQRVLFGLMWLLTELVGYLPSRRLRAGSDDAPREYIRQFHGHMRRDRWDARDGVDYAAALAQIQVPVLHVVSEGDQLARPQACARATAIIEERELLVLGRDDAPGELARLRPGHMGLVTSAGSKLCWHWIAGWLERELDDRRA